MLDSGATFALAAALCSVSASRFVTETLFVSRAVPAAALVVTLACGTTFPVEAFFFR